MRDQEELCKQYEAQLREAGYRPDPELNVEVLAYWIGLHTMSVNGEDRHNMAVEYYREKETEVAKFDLSKAVHGEAITVPVDGVMTDFVVLKRGDKIYLKVREENLRIMLAPRASFLIRLGKELSSFLVKSYQPSAFPREDWARTIVELPRTE